jgi:sulfur carrier protein
MQLLNKSLIINGEMYTFQVQFTVDSLLVYLGFNLDLIVIDYNGTVLQKEFWKQTYLNANDTIEILTVAGGG